MCKQSRGRTAYHSGLAAEDTVSRMYDRRGLVETRRRWRGKGGEIDLIFADGDTVVFVEVKKSRTHDRAAQMLSMRQQQRLCRAAEEYLGTQPRGSLTDARFDVALVDGYGNVEVIENGIMAA
ncbi:YraN family protein [Pseudoprimorskyibacter insulae]|uniref:UPF0102 protein PRI8871_00202 n=1 Tax=Pseudoprimorskyibacter insulae TaxID=1695997 RepID=A0A2R8ANH4_9RHOB|nr:YraN family protein [Pseudoprimorskyibacter insulae]SPF77618.1 hypothetical protein PRI8871_00202 [Pseudoprimorskyibacter insulae]